MPFFLVPIEQFDFHRAPRYLQSRVTPDGIPGNWSLKDFGRNSQVGLVQTDILLNQPDVFEIPNSGAWTGNARADLQAVLRAGGVEDRGWITQGGDWREGLQRLAGMALAMQSAIDDQATDAGKQDPSRWLAREIYFGALKLDPFDVQGFLNEQAILAEARRIRVGDWELIGREWVNTKTGRSIPVIAGGALPATDTFTTAVTQTLVSYGAGNWDTNRGSFNVVEATDDIYATAGGESGDWWVPDAFNNDQYAKIVISSAGTVGTYIGAACRCATSTGVQTYYGYYARNVHSQLFKMVAGTWTQLGSDGNGCVNNDVFYIDAQGTTITPKINGSTTGTPGAQTDSSMSSGAGGVSGFGNSSSGAHGDNWEGGNIGAAAATRKFQRASVLGV